MSNQDAGKQAAAHAAIAYVPPGSVVGVGTGSTVNFFIDELASIKGRIEGAVSSSRASAARLEALGIRVLDLNSVDQLALYVDGADEVTRHLTMIKGGGGALTGEKIVAAVASQFICIADQSKLVDVLGTFPLPVEVIPLARSYVGRELAKLGGQPRLRAGFTSDYGNVILDRARAEDPESAGDGSEAEPDRRRGDQRAVRAPARGPAAVGHERRGEDAHRRLKQAWRLQRNCHVAGLD